MHGEEEGKVEEGMGAPAAGTAEEDGGWEAFYNRFKDDQRVRRELELDRGLREFLKSPEARDEDTAFRRLDEYSRARFGLDAERGDAWNADRKPFATASQYADALVGITRRGYEAVATDEWRAWTRASREERMRIAGVNPNKTAASDETPGAFATADAFAFQRVVPKTDAEIDAEIADYGARIEGQNFLGVMRAYDARFGFTPDERALVRVALRHGDGLPEEMAWDLERVLRADPERGRALKDLVDRTRRTERRWWRDNAVDPFVGGFERIRRGLEDAFGEFLGPMALQAKMRALVGGSADSGRWWWNDAERAEYARLKELYAADARGRAYATADPKRIVDNMCARRLALEAVPAEERRRARRERVILEDALSHKPTVAYGYASRTLAGVLSTLPYMAVTAAPYAGFAANVLSQFETVRDGIILDGGDEDEAVGAQLLLAAGWAGIEKAQLGHLFGKPLTGLRRKAMLAKIYKASWEGGRLAKIGAYARQGAKETVVATLAESMEEGLQGALEAGEMEWFAGRGGGHDGVATLAAALKGGAGDFVESLSTMGVLSLVGAGVKVGRVNRDARGADSLAEYAAAALRAKNVLRGTVMGPERPGADVPEAARRAVQEVWSIWRRHAEDGTGGVAALDEIRERYGLDDAQTRDVGDWLDLRDNLVEAARHADTDEEGRFVAGVAGGMFRIGAPGSHLDAQALYDVVLPGTKVEEVEIDDPSAAPAAPVAEAAPSAELAAAGEDVSAAQAEVDAATVGSARRGAERRLRRAKKRLEGIRAKAPAPEAAPKPTRKAHKVTLPTGESYILDIDASSPDIDSEGWAQSVEQAMREAFADPALGEDEKPSVDGRGISLDAFRALPADRKADVAVTTGQYLEMTHAERESYCENWDLGEGARTRILDETGRELLGADAVVTIKNGFRRFVHRGGNWELAHEHGHFIAAVASRHMTPVQIATMRRLFGDPTSENERWNEENANNQFAEWLRGKYDFRVFTPEERRARMNWFQRALDTIKHLFWLSGERPPAAPVEVTQRGRALDAAFNALRSGDFSGLDVYAGIDFAEDHARKDGNDAAPDARRPVSTASGEKAGNPAPEAGKSVQAASRPVSEAPAPKPAAKPDAKRPEGGGAPTASADFQAGYDAAVAAMNANPGAFADGQSVRTGGKMTVFTPDYSMKVEAEPMWTPLASLVESTDDREVQMRDRTRAATDEQTHSTTRPGVFQPLALFPGSKSDDGAPIVGGGNRIISGHGRKRMLDILAQEGRFGEYLDAVAAEAARRGLTPPPDGMENPVLVLRVTGGLDRREDLVRFARESNRDDADARHSVRANPSLSREYDEVVARYTNQDGTKKPGWMRAPNGKPTRLTERQWVQVRTPSFKKWFGDWERGAVADAILGDADIASDGALLKMEAKAQRAEAKRIYDALKAGGPVETADGRSVHFLTRGFKEIKSHSADPHTLAIVPILKEVVASARYIGEGDVAATAANKDVKAYHIYARRVNLGDGSMVARIVIREDKNGNQFYDEESTSIENVKEIQGQGSREPNTGSGPESPYAPHSLAEFFGGINPDSVSKVVDENGEPLVVYHGSPNEFSVFDRRRIRNNTRNMRGFFFTTNRDTSGYYGKEMPCFLNVRRPLVETRGEGGEETIQAALKDGSIARHDGTIAYAGEDIKSNPYLNRGLAEDGIIEIVVPNPTQIKSATDNTGAFDPANPDIRFSVRLAPELRETLTLEPSDEATAKASVKAWRAERKAFTNRRDGRTAELKADWTKIFSEPAKKKSANYAAHYAAVNRLDTLFENGVRMWDEPPRNGSRDIRAYAKYGCPFEFGGETYLAKITVKEYADGKATDGFYSIEAISVEKIGAGGINAGITSIEGHELDPGATAVLKNMLQQTPRIVPNAAAGRNGGEMRFSIAGARGASALGVRGVADAEAMEKDGRDRTEIWRRTGWWRGSDGKWRFELPPVRMKGEEEVMSALRDGGNEATLGKLLDAPKLFVAYPQLKGVKVVFSPEYKDGIDGWYAPALGEIRLFNTGLRSPADQDEYTRKAYDNYLRIVDSDEYLRKILEDFDAISIEHGTFEEERADARWMIEHMDRRIADRNAATVRGIVNERGEESVYQRIVHEVQHAVQMAEGFEQGGDVADADYWRIAGEVEARNAARRDAMTPEERAATPPWETEDVPRSRQVIVDGHGRMTDANGRPVARSSATRRRSAGLANVATALFAQQLLAGKEVSAEDADSLLRNIGLGALPAPALLKKAKELAEANREKVQRLVRDNAPGLVAALAQNGLEAQFRDAIDGAVTGTAKAVDPSVGQRLQKAIQSKETRELMAAKGFDAAQMMAELPIDLPRGVLATADRVKTPEERAKLEEARKRREEERAAAEAEMTDEERLAAVDDPAYVPPSEESLALFKQLYDSAKFALEARQAEERRAANRRKRRRKEREAEAAKEKAGTEEGSADAAPSASAGSVPSAQADADALLPAETVARIAPVFDSPELFAQFLVEWTAKHVVERYPNIPSTAQMWKNPVAIRELKQTATHIMRKLARDCLGSPSLNYARNFVDHQINELESDAETRTYKSILRKVAYVYDAIHENALRLKRRELVNRLVNGYRAKNPETGKTETVPGIRQLAGVKGRFSAVKEEFQRAIDARTEVWARQLVPLLTMGEDRLASEIAEMERRLATDPTADDYVPMDDDARREMADRLALARKYGGLVRRMPGEIADAADEILSDLNGRRQAFEQRRLERENEDKAARDAIVDAMRAGSAMDFRKPQGRLGRYADAMQGNLTLEMQNLVRFCRDPEKRQAALEAIETLQAWISEATGRYRVVLGEAQRELREGLAACYGSAEDGIRHLLKDELDPETAAKIFKSRDKVPTYGQLLQLYASSIQSDYRENAEKHGRTAALPIMEQTLTDADKAFHAFAVEWYKRNRRALSDAVEAVTGLPVTSPDALYCPVRVQTEADGFSADAVAWSPVPAALNRRVHHGLDFNEGVNFLSVLQEQAEIRAQTIGYSAVGIRLRDILAHRETQKAARETVGKRDIKTVLDHVKDVLVQNAARKDESAFFAPLNLARKWIARFALAGNVPSAIKQLASMPVWANAMLGGHEIGLRRTMHYLATVGTDEGRAAIRDLAESDGFKARYTMGWSEETQNILMNPSKSRIIRHVEKAYDKGMVVNKAVDAISCLWMAQGFYRDARAHFLSKGIAPDEAKRMAIAMTWSVCESGQQSGRIENMNRLQRKGGAGVAAIFQFRTAYLLQNAYLLQAVKEWRAGTPGAMGRAIRAAFINCVWIPAFVQCVNLAWSALMGDEPPEEDPEKWPKWLKDFGWSMIDGVTAPMFGVSTAAHTAYDAVTGNWSWSQSSGIPAIDSAIRVTGDAVRSAADLFKSVTCLDAEEELTSEKLQKDVWRLLKDISAPVRHGKRMYDNRWGEGAR